MMLKKVALLTQICQYKAMNLKEHSEIISKCEISADSSAAVNSCIIHSKG
jgi:hypothetical protein